MLSNLSKSIPGIFLKDLYTCFWIGQNIATFLQKKLRQRDTKVYISKIFIPLGSPSEST